MKMKKILLGLAIVLPLSMGTLYVAAQEHTHAYSHMGPYTMSASPGSSHPYVTGTITDPNGKVTYIYGTCDTVHYTMREYDQCACGSVINMNNYTDVWHSACGQ